MGEQAYVDFRAIKQHVSMQAVLSRYGVQLRKVNQYSMRGKCPLPTHSSEQSKESFGVHLGKNVWACQSTSCAAARQGRKGGNVLDFVAAMEGCSIRDAALKLQKWFGNEANASPKNQRASKTEEQLVSRQEIGESAIEVNKPLAFTLKNIDPSHPYLRHRGITTEIAEHFGIGYFSGRGSMSGRVVIPIHNREGELVAYAGRAIDDSQPKYKLPTGFRKSLELFNLHRVGEREGAVVVEGFFDCIKVQQAGYPSVALMGASLSARQEEMLAGTFKKLVYLFDGDEAGRQVTDYCLLRLGRRVPSLAVDLPEGQQPDRMSSKQIQRLLLSSL